MLPTPLPTLWGITPTDQFYADGDSPWPMLLVFALGLLCYWLGRPR